MKRLAAFVILLLVLAGTLLLVLASAIMFPLSESTTTLRNTYPKTWEPNKPESHGRRVWHYGSSKHHD